MATLINIIKEIMHNYVIPGQTTAHQEMSNNQTSEQMILLSDLARVSFRDMYVDLTKVK